MEKEKITKIRSQIMNLFDSMGSQKINDFNRDGMKIREAFYQS